MIEGERTRNVVDRLCRYAGLRRFNQFIQARRSERAGFAHAFKIGLVVQYGRAAGQGFDGVGHV